MAGIGATELSLEDRIQIESLLKQGRKYGNIAVILDRSHSCIKQEVKRNCGRENYNANEAHNAAMERKKAKIKKIQKGITEKQLDTIKKGISENLSQNKIRELCGLSHWKISQYFKENKIHYVPRNYTAFEERISALEEQINLIFELVKELMNDK
jgi:IS30 family transposase